MRLARACAREHAPLMNKLLTRIVLSSLLLTACAYRDSASDPLVTADDEPASSDGIGTSPSGCFGACDPEGVAADMTAAARRAPEPSVAPPSCGVWFDTSTEVADLRALACVPADAVVHTAGHSTCVDALALASLRSGYSVVRRLTYRAVAIEADCP